MTAHYPLYIDGQSVDTGRKIEILNKSTGSALATVASATPEEVEMAVAAARRAFDGGSLSPYERYKFLKRVSEILLEEKDDLARTLALEVGKPLKEAYIEVERAAQTFEISAEEAKRIHGEGIPVEASPGSETRMAFTIRVPVGVVCAITPFNVPLNLVAHKVGPALAAGNSVVLKPTSATPIVAVKLAQAFDKAGLPKGWFNLLIGSGSEVGGKLAKDQRIDLYTFTGSPSVGKKLKDDVGLRKVLLELGSNSAVIVHEDADLAKAAKLCAAKSFGNSGQVCISVQRIYVHRNVREQFRSLLAAETAKLVVGDPLDDKTDIGPMISEQEARRAEEWVNEAVAAGANLVAGGTRNGAYYVPTILEDVTPEMKVVCEEVFAPVVSMVTFDDLDEAIRLVNDSKYGLQAGIFTSSLQSAMKAARSVKVGGLIVNDASQYRADQMPYGGVKESGWGKEGPKYAIEEMTEQRIVVLNL